MPPGKQVINGLKDGLRTLPYVGGKSNFGGPGKWIAEILDTVKSETYVEPCMGTLGILLRRSPAQVEICNDKDKRVVNFFETVRDHTEEFCDALFLTPVYSEETFVWAKRNLHNSHNVTAAIACFVVLNSSIPASLIQRSDYLILGNRGKWRLPDDVIHLANRLREVRFVCEDAPKIITDYVKRKDTLIYIDPPYPDTLGYECSIDGQVMLDSILTNRKAHVAVSGFRDSWPELESGGFFRHDRPIHLQMDTAKNGRRVESLYTSWIPDMQTLL